MISIITYDKAGAIRRHELDELRGLIAAATSDETMTIWVDLDRPTEEEENVVLRDAFGFHHLAIHDCRREKLDQDHGDHLPKVEDFQSYLFVIINAVELSDVEPPRTNDNRVVATRQLNAFLGRNFIVTHHYEQSHPIVKILALCAKSPAHLERGPDYVYHLILDDIVDEYSPILDEFDRCIHELEERIFDNADRTLLSQILRLKQQVFQLRRITLLQREMVYRLARGEFALITDQEIAYYRNVFDHLVRAAEMTESYREVLTGMVEVYMSMNSHRLNEVMKVLAVISVFFLPLTFIAGVYGMNFDPDTSPWNMPELRWFLGYPFALGLMLLTVIGMIVYFRRKKWL